jgi:hypothetical protein
VNDEARVAAPSENLLVNVPAKPVKFVYRASGE